MVEYEDEFGRMRTARRSEVPRDLVPPTSAQELLDDEYALILIVIPLSLIYTSTVHMLFVRTYFPYTFDVPS